MTISFKAAKQAAFNHFQIKQEDINMNEILKAMKERRSIRSFKPDMPSREDLEKIIEAGLYAPSGMGKQSPIIVAVTNKDKRDALSALNASVMGMPRDPFYGAPAVLAVLEPADRPTGVEDGSLVLGNMLLAAHSLGLGSIWIHRAKEEFENDEWKKLLKDLGVEGDYRGVGNCCVGYIEGEAPKRAERKKNRVYWVD